MNQALALEPPIFSSFVVSYPYQSPSLHITDMANKGPTDVKRKPKKTPKVTATEEEKKGSKKGKQSSAKNSKRKKNAVQVPTSDDNGTDTESDEDDIKIE
jgi:hypothetical protein